MSRKSAVVVGGFVVVVGILTNKQKDMLCSLLWIKISLDGSNSDIANYSGSFWLSFLYSFEDFELVKIDTENFSFERIQNDIVGFELSTDLNFRLGVENRVS